MEKIILAFCIVNFIILCFIQANMVYRKQNDSQDQKESKDADESVADCEHIVKEYSVGIIEYKQCIKCGQCF